MYREQLDQAVGVVYVRNFLSYLGDGAGQEPITPLIHKAWLSFLNSGFSQDRPGFTVVTNDFQILVI